MNFAPPRALFGAILLVLLASSPAHAWLFGKNHPSKSEIATYVEDMVPDYLTIEKIKIGSRETRHGIVEYSETRLQVSLAPAEPLYRRVGALEDRTPLIALATRAGTPKIAFALVEAVARGEGWDSYLSWDDADEIRALGRPRSDYSETALMEGSEAHHAHVALLEQQRKAEEAAKEKARLEEMARVERERQAEQKARRELYEAVAGPFEGTVACYRSYEVASLTLDVGAGTGSILWRQLQAGDMEWHEDPLTVKENRNDGTIRVSGPKPWRLVFKRQGKEIVFNDRGCDFALYPKGAVPEEVMVKRAAQHASVTRFSTGPATIRVTEGSREIPVIAEVLEVGERHIRFRVEHPRIANTGSFTTGDDRSVSTVDVRLTDAPAPTLLAATTVEGRGAPVVESHCHQTVEITETGALRLQDDDGFSCKTRLVLTP